MIPKFNDCFYTAACSKNYHHKCKDKLPNLCGINQKLLADALVLAEVSNLTLVNFNLDLYNEVV